jgi:hypothetical protein
MTRRLSWLALVIGLTVLASACPRGLLTRFPHRQHLAELECGGPGQAECLSCASCHLGDGQKAGAWHKPRKDNCGGSTCHKAADLDEVYARSLRPSIAPQPAGKAIVFAHDPHLDQPTIKGQCVGCHSGAVGTEGGDPLFPPMDTCLTCHEHRTQFDNGVCTNCHKDADLRQLVPQSVFRHDGAWQKRHGLEARQRPAACEQCHAQTSCDSCHDSTRPSSPAMRNPEAIERELVHRFDFLTRHSLEAQSQPGTCVTCHAKTECDACHVARGVSAARAGAEGPHPALWASGLGAARNTHGKAARRDIASCAACHDQGPASNCVRCHRVGGSGGTPHPAGWRSSAPRTNAECSACHGGSL